MKTMSKLMLAVMLLWTTGLSAQQTSGETSQRRIKEEGKTIFDPHFFMQIQGGVAHTIGEGDFGDLLSPALVGGTRRIKWLASKGCMGFSLHNLQVQLPARKCRCHVRPLQLVWKV